MNQVVELLRAFLGALAPVLFDLLRWAAWHAGYSLFLSRPTRIVGVDAKGWVLREPCGRARMRFRSRQ